MASLTVPQHAYNYEPLDLSRQQIRLIALEHSSKSRDEIACHLHIFDVESAPSYVALSYTWGPPTPTRIIYIDRKAFDIRQNLYNFLYNYRNDRSNKCYIWIDQICISQAHAGERNHQVQQMSRIYKNCLHAIIWLGQESQDTARSFTAEPTQHLACALLRNEYFRRLWIIQEIILSPKARILCGSVWLRVLQLVQAVQGQDEAQLTPIEFIDFILIDATIWRFEPMSLEICLGKYAKHHCQDPRDKVYGLLSLVDIKQRVTVDYTRSVVEVFLDVVMILFCMSWKKEFSREMEWFHRCKWLMKFSRQMGVEQGCSLSAFLHALGGVELPKVMKLGFVTMVDGYELKHSWWCYYTWTGKRVGFERVPGSFPTSSEKFSWKTLPDS